MEIENLIARETEIYLELIDERNSINRKIRKSLNRLRDLKIQRKEKFN